MGYTVTRGYPAPAEVVFGTATDMDRWARWLPAGVAVERAGEDELHVTQSGRTHTLRWHTSPERLEAGVQAVAPPWSATMRVDDEQAGSSRVVLEIDGDGGVLRHAAEQALKFLDAEVADNFNAG